MLAVSMHLVQKKLALHIYLITTLLIIKIYPQIMENKKI